MKIIKRGLDKIGRKNERKISLERATFSWWSGFTLVNENTFYLNFEGCKTYFFHLFGNIYDCECAQMGSIFKTTFVKRLVRLKATI